MSKDQKTGVHEALAKVFKAGGMLLPLTGEPVGIGGGIVAMLLSEVIPQRWRRNIEREVRLLDYKFEGISDEVLLAKAEREEFQELLEEAMKQAARASSDERREYIANFLKRSLTSEELKQAQRRRLLELLHELSDAEVILLKYLALDVTTPREERDEFFERHEEILSPDMTSLGQWQSDPVGVARSRRRAAFRSQGISNLAALGLIDLGARHEQDRFDALMKDYQKHGSTFTSFGWRRPDLHNYEATHLGALLIEWIEDENFEVGDELTELATSNEQEEG